MTGSEHFLISKEGFNFKLECILEAGESAFLMEAIDDVQTTIKVDTTEKYPTWGVFKIGSERIRYTSKGGGVEPYFSGCTRGYGETLAQSHDYLDPVSGSFDWYMKITDIKIRTKEQKGSVYRIDRIPFNNGERYKRLEIKKDETEGWIDLKSCYSKDNVVYSDWLGPDGSPYSSFGQLFTHEMTPLPINFSKGMLNYYKWRVDLYGNCFESPSFNMLYFHLTHQSKNTDAVSVVECPATGFVNPLIVSPIPITILTQTYGTHENYQTIATISECDRYWIQSGKKYDTVVLEIIRSWLESEVGKIMSGYCKDQDGNVITSADGGWITLTNGTESDPNDVSGFVKPSGLYQIFMFGDKDDWHLIVHNPDGDVDPCYRQYPDTDFIDGENIPDYRDLGFYVTEFGNEIEVGDKVLVVPTDGGLIIVKSGVTVVGDKLGAF